MGDLVSQVFGWIITSYNKNATWRAKWLPEMTNFVFLQIYMYILINFRTEFADAIENSQRFSTTKKMWNKGKIIFKMIEEVCSIFCHSCPNQPWYKRGLGLEMVTNMFSVLFFELERTEQTLFTNYCVYLFWTFWGYLKDWCKGLVSVLAKLELKQEKQLSLLIKVAKQTAYSQIPGTRDYQ